MHELVQSQDDLGNPVEKLKLQEPTNKNNFVIGNASSDENTEYHNSGLKMSPCHLRFENHDQRNGSVFDSQSVTKSEGDRSECTNPYLEMLLDRYFPSDDEDIGCDADGEYDDADSFTNCRKRPSPRQTSPLRKRSSPARRGTNPIGNTRQDSIFRNPEQHSPFYNKNTTEWFQEARRKYVEREVKRQQNGKFELNLWDSSPSSVESADFTTESRDKSTSNHSALIGYLQEEYKYADSFHKNSTEDDDIRKALFTPIREDEVAGASSLRDNFDEKYDMDSDNDDQEDLDIIYRTRKIQHDIRLQQLEEIAVLAERAAAEGQDIFVGEATRFGIDDDKLSIIAEIESSYNDEVGNANNLSESRHSLFVMDKSNHSQGVSSPSQTARNKHYSQAGIIPNTDIKRPKSLTLQDRFSSAPSKLQIRNSSPTIIPSLSNSVPSILTAKSFLSLAQSKVVENKVPVLALRHIEEVIPSFGEMHPYVKSFMVRAGVKREMLQSVDEIEDRKKVKKQQQDEKGSATGSRTSSNSKFPRIPSFHKLFQSFSGLSVDESIHNNVANEIVESDVEIGTASELEVESEICSSLQGLTGELSLGTDATIKKREEKQNHNLLLDEIDQGSRDDKKQQSNGVILAKSSSEQSEIYVCTLASEINSPKRRPRSPPVQSPYGDIEVKMVDVLKQEMYPGTTNCDVVQPQSRWTSFWANISPKKSLLMPITRRAQSLPLESELEFRKDFSRRLSQHQSEAIFSFSPFISTSSSLLERTNMQYSPFSPTDEIKPRSAKNQDRNVSQSTKSHLHSKEEAIHKTTKSLKISTTQPTSYETESSGSPFSQYSKLTKLNDQYHDTREISTMSIDRDSAASPKPPLHPAGVRLANLLLNNAGIKKDTEKMVFNVSSKGRCHNSKTDGNCNLDSSYTVERELELDKTTKDKRISSFEQEEKDSKGNNNELKRQRSFASIASLCLGEETSLCGEEPSMHGSLHDDIKKLTTDDDGESSALIVDDMNKSTASIMNLVPSVLDRFSPLLGKKEHKDTKSTYQDAYVFVGNYFYMGVGPEDDSIIEVNDSACSEEKQRFCSRTPCIDTTCGDFGSSVLNHAFQLLSHKSSWEKESGPLLNEPQAYDQKQWLRIALCQCANKQYNQRREVVVIHNKRYRAPTLQIQKGGFFSRRGQDIGQVQKNMITLGQGIDVGPVHFITETKRRTKIDQDRLNIKKQALQLGRQSLLNFSDQSDTDESVSK